MKHWRAALAVVTIVILGVAAPLAMAADNCVAMGAMCEGPCGASSCVSAPPTGNVAQLVAAAPSAPASHAPEIDPTVLELPPK